MSFLDLPYELQEAVAGELLESDLVSLCLVSKVCVGLARPYLYRNVVLIFQTWRNRKAWSKMAHGIENRLGQATVDLQSKIADARTDFSRDERAKNNLLQTLHSVPEIKNMVVNLSVHTFVPMADVPEFEELLRLLKTGTRLRTFQFSKPDDIDITCLVENLPPQLTSLDLQYVNVSRSDQIALISRLPLLRYLIIPAWPKGDTEVAITSGPTFKFRDLTLADGFESSPFFSTLTRSNNSFTSLSVSYGSLPFIDLLSLRHLVSLTNEGRFTAEERHGGELEGPFDLAAVFRACPELERLEWMSLYSGYSSIALTKLESTRVLHHLPKTLATLVLSNVNFDVPYLLDFLSDSTRSLSLLYLTRPLADRFPAGEGDSLRFDLEGQAKIKVVLRQREIDGAWIKPRLW